MRRDVFEQLVTVSAQDLHDALGHVTGRADFGEVERDRSGFDGDERNPLTIAGTSFFRDEYGERHVFPARGRKRVHATPFVPRDMIAGRALLVFWPYVPSLDVYRLGWIR